MATGSSDASRRGFLKSSAVAAAGASILTGLDPVRAAYAAGNDTIRIGLVGCGGRGSGAAEQALNTEGPTKLVAMADAFDDNLQRALKTVSKAHGEKLTFPKNASSLVSTPTRRSSNRISI